MARLIFLPIADAIESGTYLLYDGPSPGGRQRSRVRPRYEPRDGDRDTEGVLPQSGNAKVNRA